MGTQELSKISDQAASMFDDFIKPWNEWFNNPAILTTRPMKVPAVNITEQEQGYLVALAAPGMKKDDFKIKIDGNLLTVSSEKEETKEENDKKFNRKEYSYSSFSRSFSLPAEVNKEKIEATYEDGILQVTLPRKEELKKAPAKQIPVK